MSIQIPHITEKASSGIHLYFFTKGPLSLFVFDLCVNKICEAIVAFAGDLFAFPFISFWSSAFRLMERKS